jgi:3-hydroxyisobutyrate dehydrogenase
VSTRVGFVGLGNLGVHLARSLLRAGFPLAVHDLDRDAAAGLVAGGATWAGSPAELAEGADTIVTCLPSPAASAAVLAGVLEGAREGAVWIEMSTTDADEVRRLAALAAERGVGTVEAPVTGGVHLAAAGEITILTGGDEALVASQRPLLVAVGGRVVHLGPLGNATVVKVVTNLLAFIHLLAAGEALMLVRRAGIDLAAAFEAIRASSGTSFVLETEGQLVLNGSYDVGFTMDMALKDLGFALDLAREGRVPLDLGAAVAQAFVRARETYGGGAQSTMAVKLLEDALGTDLRAPGFPARL